MWLFFLTSTPGIFYWNVSGTKWYKPSQKILELPPGIEPVIFSLWGGSYSDDQTGRLNFNSVALVCWTRLFYRTNSTRGILLNRYQIPLRSSHLKLADINDLMLVPRWKDQVRQEDCYSELYVMKHDRVKSAWLKFDSRVVSPHHQLIQIL